MLLLDKVHVENRSTANRKNTMCFRRISSTEAVLLPTGEIEGKLELSGWVVSFVSTSTHILTTTRPRKKIQLERNDHEAL